MIKYYAKYCLFITLINTSLISNNQIYAQNTNKLNLDSTLSISAFVETYYGYDFQDPNSKRRPGFLFNHARHNEVNLNLGLVKLSYNEGRVRGNLGLMVGNYVSENLSAEPLAMRNIYEANVGVKLLKKHDLWLDVGIMESNLGFESVIGPKNWMMTRSLLAESSPYYLNNAKLTYTAKNEKWMIAGLFSNGWQIMVDGYPSFGHQIQWYPNKKWTINSSSFIGRANIPSSSAFLIGDKVQRYFHNFYLKYDGEKFGIILSADLGLDQRVQDPELATGWVGIAIVTRYSISEKFAISARGELLSDPDQSVVISPNYSSFLNIGTSLNFDYQIFDRLLWRVEGRAFSSENPIYRYNGQPTTSNYYLGTSLSLMIGEM
jgi:hypothetical protein